MTVATADPAAPSAPRERITGYDLARSLAILGMAVVHFTLVMSFARMDEGWLARVVGFLDGRAAATFVVLAGVGLSLRSGRAAADDSSMRCVRSTLLKRGMFLLAAGYLNLLIWPGDILRVYGVSLMIAAWLIRARDRTLLLVAVGFVAAFLSLFLSIDYSKNWDWETLEYHRLWTPGGAARNLFYDGFRSVFPWTGLLFLGMWLGRRDIRDRSIRARLLLWGVGIVIAAETLSRLLVRVAVSRARMGSEDAFYLFGTGSMPPLPIFLLSSTGTAVALIAASVAIAERFPLKRVVRALVAAGQLAFTWYVAHIVLGLGLLILLGLTENYPVVAGILGGVAFFAAAAALSLLWRRRFRHGPLEWLMRRVAG